MYKSIFILLIAIILNSCGNTQTNSTPTSLSATEFAEQLKKDNTIQLLDVRTPGEFKNGHVENAINASIVGSDFENQIAALDKSKPVFVYCLSGPRSHAAAKQMRVAGFKNVVEMPGGMMEWRAKSMPETKDATAIDTKGLSLAQYEALLRSDKMVLVDFYADWCAPCKEMKPYLDKIAIDMANNVVLVRIDADANTELCKALKIDALPVLKLYKNKKMVWDNLGFIDEASVRKQLK
ncbi:thioredoxin domain-containing protein [Pedobacter psychroterrae]|uniref:Thioredoxin n=1 Tax=Pedobacter psychroterrae TaxID=2530453 RepID=A0A4V2MLC7_9SPHI|nr:thioredoxin domain-containing protein [Pedobacter psychroterrae]TCD01527.1 thioredoxin [Pedobacter psychroterrae]